MRALVVEAPGQFGVQEVPKPSLREGCVLLRVKACGVCGSDFSRIFGHGAHRLPLIPGHEFSGVVEELAEGVDEKWQGKRVAVFPLIPCRRCAMCSVGEYAQCAAYDYLGSRSDGAFAEYVVVPTWNLLPIPDQVSFEEAAMMEPAAVALHALRLGGLTGGMSVVIFGAGPIGLLLAHWAKALGCTTVCLVDIDPLRLDYAKCLGFFDLFDAREDGIVSRLLDKTGGGADLVIEGSGSSAAFEQTMQAARPFGTVVLMGNPLGEMKLSQQAYWAIMRKQLHVRGTWNSSYGESSHNDWATTLDFLAAKKLCVCHLVTHRPTLEELPTLLKSVVTREVFTCKVMALP